MPEDMEGTSVYVFGGEPQGEPHRSLHIQGHRGAGRQPCYESHAGKELKDMGYEGGLWKKQDVVGIKAPVFSMSKLTGVDWHLGQR